MNRTTAAVLIALAFSAGNIAATNASNKQRLQHHFSPPPVDGPANFQAKPFPANCVAGFQKHNEKKIPVAGVPVVSGFWCRTAWIECPNFPAFDETWLEYEVKDQTTGNEGKRIRVKYNCTGNEIAG